MKSRIYIHVALMLMLVMTCGCAFRQYKEEPWRVYADALNRAQYRQQYDLAEENYEQCLIALKKRGKFVDWVYFAASRAYEAKGNYTQAFLLTKSGQQVNKDRYDKDNTDISSLSAIADCYCGAGEILVAQGKFEEALLCIERGLKMSEQLMRNPLISTSTISHVYPSLGNYYLQRGAYDKARHYSQEILDRYVKENMFRTDYAGRARIRLAQVYYCAGDYREAEKLLEKAVNPNAVPSWGFMEDITQGILLLGQVKAQLGEGDKALNAWQSILTALRHDTDHLGYRVEQSNVLNQIGRFYVKQGNPEEAVKAYNEAIALRIATATQTHPNCADAIKGLADWPRIKTS